MEIQGIKAKLDELPDELKKQVLDYIEFLLQKYGSRTKKGKFKFDPKYSYDALHVALATVSNCLLIVSWNFKHIVHFEKIPLLIPYMAILK